MQAKLEISLYPLTGDFIPVILEFIRKINTCPGITVETNQLSTQIFGDYDTVTGLVLKELKEVYAQHKAVAVMKLIGIEE